ncbi:MAG: uroporphyrinogen-III synthase [Methanobrevibacter sp.]|jgi:uroporphyrinogen-III synthase|nr:uroporphyrinogen-III synthase [Methanobrevibacter sp.]
MNNYKKKVVAITRPFNRIDEAIDILTSYNAQAFIAPTLELKLVNSPSLKKLISKLDKMNCLIFTSITTVESIFQFYPDFKNRLTNKTKIVAIGTKTAEKLNEHNLNVDVIPDNFTAEGIIESFKKISIKDNLIGIPRTLDARLILPEKLKELGANVLIAEAYKSILPMDTVRVEVLIAKILNNEIDAITFTSPLTVKNLFKILPIDQKYEFVNKLSTSTLTVSIGPITHQTLEEFNINSIYPSKYTVKAMFELLFETL